MGTGHHTAAKAAFVLGLLIWGAIGNPDLISPAIAQPATLTKKQSDALDIYTKAVKNFELVLSQRRAQIDSRQPLPNLPGQALYLARNGMMSAAKDLTDALPSKIGRPNKFGIPPAYFDADNEPLLDEYVRLFDDHAGAAGQRAKIRHAIQGRRRSRNCHCARQRPRCGGCRRGGPHQPRAVLCRNQRQSEHRQCTLEQIQGKFSDRPVRGSKRPKEMGGDQERR